MRVHSQGIRIGLAVLAILGGSVAIAAPANAVATPAEACGDNYHEIDYRDVPGARIHLLYNGSVDCVATTNNTPGKKVGLGAFIEKLKDGVHSDPQAETGGFWYYAGPVRVTAPHTCVGWGGSGPTKTIVVGPDHCG